MKMWLGWESMVGGLPVETKLLIKDNGRAIQMGPWSGEIELQNHRTA